MSEPKYAYRLPPCPIYDTHRTEAWLEDLAKKGLILTDQGFTCGFLCFEKAQPKAIRYRILPCQPRTFLNDGGPQPAEVELAEEFGWKYHAFHKEFAVFCTEDPSARELETDPQVRAMVVRKHYRKAIRETVFCMLIVAALLAFLLQQGILVYYSTRPVWNSFFWTLLTLSLLPCGVPRLLYLRRLKRQLEMSEMPAREVPTRQESLRYRLLSTLLSVTLICFWVSHFLQIFLPWQAGLWKPVNQHPDDLPVPTLVELAGGGTYDVGTWVSDPNNVVASRSTVLMNRHGEYRQAGVVTQDGETVLSGMILAEYYEMRTEWLAKELFRELGKYYRRGVRDQIEKLPELSVDEADAFSNYLLLRQGNKVLKLQLLQHSPVAIPRIPTKEWAVPAVEAFIK